MPLEEMAAFFDARVDGYETHMRKNVAGSGVFYAGVPSARTTAHVQGVCVVRAGVPTADASAVAQGQGVLAFYSGAPRISGVTVRPRTALCFRSGTPTINRGATC